MTEDDRHGTDPAAREEAATREAATREVGDGKVETEEVEAEVVPPWGTPPPPRPVVELPPLPAPTVRYPAPQYEAHTQPYRVPRPTRTSSWAVLSLVLALLWFFWLGSLLAIVAGHVALGEMRRDPTVGGRGAAIAGLVIGYGSVALGVLPLLAVLTLVGALTL